jgi:hypothetical protein
MKMKGSDPHDKDALRKMKGRWKNPIAGMGVVQESKG